RQAPTQAAGFLADLDCTIIDVSCRDSELSEIPCGEPRKTVFSRSNRDLFPFVVGYRTMNGAGNLQTALRYFRAMVRCLTMRGDSVFTVRRFFEIPCGRASAATASAGSTRRSGFVAGHARRERHLAAVRLHHLLGAF